MAGVAGEAGEAASKGFSKMMEKLAQGKAINHSNESISRIGNSLLGGGELGAKMFKGAGPTEAFDSTFRKAVKEGAAEGTKGDLNWGKIAGSYMGISAAYRVASGGGIHRDQNGNPNLIGVPFV